METTINIIFFFFKYSIVRNSYMDCYKIFTEHIERCDKTDRKH